MGNKHYHCCEWFDIDTASRTLTEPVTADWQRDRKRGSWMEGGMVEKRWDVKMKTEKMRRSASTRMKEE